MKTNGLAQRTVRPRCGVRSGGRWRAKPRRGSGRWSNLGRTFPFDSPARPRQIARLPM